MSGEEQKVATRERNLNAERQRAAHTRAHKLFRCRNFDIGYVMSKGEFNTPFQETQMVVIYLCT